MRTNHDRLAACLLLLSLVLAFTHAGFTNENTKETKETETTTQKRGRFLNGINGNGVYPAEVVFTVGGGYYPENGGIYPSGGYPGVYPVFGGQNPPAYPNNPEPNDGTGDEEVPVSEADGDRNPDAEVEIFNVPRSNGEEYPAGGNPVGGYPGGVYPGGFYPGGFYPGGVYPGGGYPGGEYPGYYPI